MFLRYKSWILIIAFYLYDKPVLCKLDLKSYENLLITQYTPPQLDPPYPTFFPGLLWGMCRPKSDVRSPKIVFPMSNIFLLTTQYGACEEVRMMNAPPKLDPQCNVQLFFVDY